MAENPSDKIAKELEQSRERLFQHVEQLQQYLSPKNVASRGFAKISDFFVTEDGQPKIERVAATGASILAFFGLALKKRGEKSSE